MKRSTGRQPLKTAVTALVVIGFLGYTKLKTDATTVAPTRPAMMSPSATAYVTEEGDDDENPTAPISGKQSDRKVRKLSF